MPGSTSASPNSSVHPASLVDPANHSPALVQLLNIELSPAVIEYIVDCVVETVDYGLERIPFSSPPTGARPKFTAFVSTVLSRAEVSAPTVLTALVYVARARSYLLIAVEKLALERVFLGALIVAAKYTRDNTLRNKHWALCAGLFKARDISRIEREFLAVLDWELGVQEGDLMDHHEGLVAAASGSAKPVSAWAEVVVETHELALPVLEPSSPHSESSPESASFRTPCSRSCSPPPHPPPHQCYAPPAYPPPPSSVLPPPTHHVHFIPASFPSPRIGAPRVLRAMQPNARMELPPPKHKPGKLHTLLRALPHPLSVPILRAHRHGNGRTHGREALIRLTVSV
ncbi:hypothetical protein DFH07DRAFT_145866 [Mycena maculata]|uniref:Cyclin N-terminal domain-containing protein n=1 Tax=Mycena maculata TaxID=230809 RepID=A0AAD7JXX9_9AGAR|nr:hypothetical protein DFH07DRAFT_145866 [Mycena maculata]